VFQMTGGAFQMRNIHELRPFPGEFRYFESRRTAKSPSFTGSWSNHPTPTTVIY
jgi:hypothetical protein